MGETKRQDLVITHVKPIRYKLLLYIRPRQRSSFGIIDIPGIKLLTHLHVEFPVIDSPMTLIVKSLYAPASWMMKVTLIFSCAVPFIRLSESNSSVTYRLLFAQIFQFFLRIILQTFFFMKAMFITKLPIH